jgi:hypothetical protein
MAAVVVFSAGDVLDAGLDFSCAKHSCGSFVIDARSADMSGFGSLLSGGSEVALQPRQARVWVSLSFISAERLSVSRRRKRSCGVRPPSGHRRSRLGGDRSVPWTHRHPMLPMTAAPDQI